MNASNPEDKHLAHMEKTKRAVLQQIAEKGGSASLSELHSFSEAKYFVAHQKFSMLMEDCVHDELVDFAEDNFSLTEKGRSYLQEG